MRRPFFHDFIGGLSQRRAAHRQRTRAVGAKAEIHLAGITVHHFHVVYRHTETAGNELRESGFVTLAVAVGAGEHGDTAGGVHPNFPGFPQSHPGAQRTGHLETAQGRRLRCRC